MTAVIDQIIQDYRNAIAARDMQVLADLTSSWMKVEQGLEADIAALASETARRIASGEIVTEQMLWKMQSYRRTLVEMEGLIAKYNKTAVDLIGKAQLDSYTLGVWKANDLVIAQINSAGLTPPYWERLNKDAIEAALGVMNDENPFYVTLGKDYGDAAEAFRQALADGIARGQGVIQLADGLNDAIAMGLDRSMLIAQTEMARAYRSGTVEQYRESGVVTGYRRLAKKETACLACLVLDGEYYELAEDMEDHPRGYAELPDNLIITDDPITLETFRYNGDIVVISTASGKFLTVTKQHPVLTDRGWVAAEFVKEGDNVFSCAGSDWAATCPDKNHVPTFAKDLASTYDMVRLGRVPVSSKYLYRNGENSEIDIVFINRQLWEGYDPSVQQKVSEFYFGMRRIGSGPFNPFRSLNKKLTAFTDTAKRVLGVLDHGSFIRLAHVGSLQSDGFGYSPALDPIANKKFADRTPIHQEYLGEFIFGSSPFVGINDRECLQFGKDDLPRIANGVFRSHNMVSFGFTPEQPLSLEDIRQALLRSVPAGSSRMSAIASNVIHDRVINIEIRRFVGHVYNLQNKPRWYLSNGIISHNCDVISVVEGVGSPDWEKGKDWLEQQSEERQREIMGDTRYDMWKDGTPLEDLVYKKEDPVWGPQPAIKPLRDTDGYRELGDMRLLEKFEDSIRNNHTETGALFDDHGNKLFNIKGDAHTLHLTDEQRKLLEGNILTHNHPTGNMTFSDNDIKFALEYKLKEMRAVTRDYDFVLDLKWGGKDIYTVPQWSVNTINPIIERILNEKYYLFESGKMDLYELNDMVAHDALVEWFNRSEQMQNSFDYQRIKK